MGVRLLAAVHRTVRPAGSLGRAADPAARSGQAQALDGGADLGDDLVGDRRVVDAREDLLAVLAGDVAQEGLGGGQGVGLVALVAGDLVGDQGDRVGAVGLGRRSPASSARSLPVPTTLASAMALEALSAVALTGAAAPVSTVDRA